MRGVASVAGSTVLHVLGVQGERAGTAQDDAQIVALVAKHEIVHAVSAQSSGCATRTGRRSFHHQRALQQVRKTGGMWTTRADSAVYGLPSRVVIVAIAAVDL